jgi:membrane protein DedA with SNARE-associated domain
MSDILEQVRIWVEGFILALGYPGIAIMMFLENIFPPIPSEFVMPFSGFLVVRGDLTFAGVLIAGTLGVLAGALVLYYLGAEIGEDRLRGWVENYGRYVLVSQRDIDRAKEIFDRHGEKIILVGRLVPGVRSLISIPAGLDRMALWKFLLLTLLGSAFWNFLLVFAGVLLGRNWERVLSLIDQYQIVVWSAIAVIVFVFIARRLRSR